MGSSLQVWLQQPMFIYTGALIFVLLALSLFGVFEFRMPAVMRNVIVSASNRQRGGAYAGVFLMGVLSALLVSPCVTAPLVGVLMYVASTGNVLLGASALFAIGIGMGIPLIAVGVSAGKWLPKRGPWMNAVSKFFGLVMLAMAIWLLSRVVTFSLTALLYGVLLLLGGLVIGVYLPRHIGWKRLHYSLGALTAVTGVVFIAMAFNAANLTGYVQRQANNKPTPFVVVHNQQALDQALETARAKMKPALIDFYADWCASCVEMEKEVFDKASVLTQLQNFMLIRVDLTDNSAEDQALLARYDVVAPPTVLLINQSGHEDDKLRIIGEMSANEFISRIQVFAQAHCDKKMIC
jgi:thiol:disulfide interchange protein DsbD